MHLDIGPRTVDGYAFVDVYKRGISLRPLMLTLAEKRPPKTMRDERFKLGTYECSRFYSFMNVERRATNLSSSNNNNSNQMTNSEDDDVFTINSQLYCVCMFIFSSNAAPWTRDGVLLRSLPRELLAPPKNHFAPQRTFQNLQFHVVFSAAWEAQRWYPRGTLGKLN